MATSLAINFIQDPDASILPPDLDGIEAPTMPADKPVPGSEAWKPGAVDAKGLSASYHFNGMPVLRYWMNEILHRRVFPYRDEADILRHAVHRHIEWLRTHPSCPRHMLTQMQAMSLVLEEEHYNQQFEHVLQETGRLVDTAVKRGALDAAQQLVGKLWNHLMQMEESYWKKYYVSRFKAEFGKYIK